MSQQVMQCLLSRRLRQYHHCMCERFQMTSTSAPAVLLPGRRRLAPLCLLDSSSVGCYLPVLGQKTLGVRHGEKDYVGNNVVPCQAGPDSDSRLLGPRIVLSQA